MTQQPSEEWIVQEYLKRGNLLIIDSLTLNSYPLQRHRHLYLKYGKVTSNLMLRGCASANAWTEFPSGFQNISELTLSNVKWASNARFFKGLPSALRRLKLKFVKVKGLHWWLEQSQTTLESLHLKGIQSEVDLNFATAPIFYRLKSLTLMRNDLCLEGLRRACPFLDYLYLDVQCIDCPTKHFPNTVSTLIMRWPYMGINGLKYLKYFKNLQHLEILEQIDSCHSEDIMSLNLKTVKVAFNHYDCLDPAIFRIKYGFPMGKN